jgi:hypothetical protein
MTTETTARSAPADLSRDHIIAAHHETYLADVTARLTTLRDEGVGLTLTDLLKYIDEAFGKGAHAMADGIQGELHALELAIDTDDTPTGDNIIQLAFPPSEFIRPWGTSQN